MQTEDKIYGLIVQAQEMQKYALEFRGTAEDAIGKLPDATRSAVKDAAREFIIEGAEKASRSLVEASGVAKAAAEQLRGSDAVAMTKHLLVLVLVALIISAAIYFGLGFLAKQRAAELDRLNGQMAVAGQTLDKLLANTWGLELTDFGKDGRWIVLPKGVTFIKSGNMQDGREALLIK